MIIIHLLSTVQKVDSKGSKIQDSRKRSPVHFKEKIGRYFISRDKLTNIMLSFIKITMRYALWSNPCKEARHLQPPLQQGTRRSWLSCPGARTVCDLIGTFRRTDRRTDGRQRRHPDPGTLRARRAISRLVLRILHEIMGVHIRSSIGSSTIRHLLYRTISPKCFGRLFRGTVEIVKFYYRESGFYKPRSKTLGSSFIAFTILQNIQKSAAKI